ncbi:hypothetical protein HH297_02385 [Xanthomonas sp. Kuri4-3]
MRSPFDILEAYERRSLAHATQLPERQFAADIWRGVGYRVGTRRLVSDFREVVEIVPMPPVTPVPGAQPWLLGVGNLRGNLWEALSPRGGTGVLVPFEFGWTPTSADGRIGEYKIGGWYSGADRQDVYEDIAGGPASASELPLRWHDGAHGAFVSAVRQLTRGRGETAKSGWRAVFKASVADRATSTVDRTFAATFVYTGPSARRPLDDAGIAIAFNHLNERVADYRAERLALGHPGPLPGNGERTVEAYYSFRFGSVLMVRPDLQWIRHPGGVSRRQDVVIVGVRTEITF